MEKTRWAIVGTGHISNQFAKGMECVSDASLEAVVSRSSMGGEKFAKRYNAESWYTDFETMLEEVQPDVVYLGIPNDAHFSYIMKALEAGVHVLSEKPMVDNEKQLEEILGKAREKKLFLMEGMWTRCFPAVRQARQWMEEGQIGKALSVRAGFDIKPNPGDWQPWKAGIAHSGSALRDVGIYSLGMAYLAFPEGPCQVHSTRQMNSEVDISSQLMLCYDEGRSAFLSGSFNSEGMHEAVIMGEDGSITIGPEFWHPEHAVLKKYNGSKTTFELPYQSTGFQYEIMEVQECLKACRQESPTFTWQESTNIGKLIEDTRKEWGIFYEADNHI